MIKKDEQDNSKSGAKKEDEALRVIEPEAMSMENQHANQTVRFFFTELSLSTN